MEGKEPTIRVIPHDETF